MKIEFIRRGAATRLILIFAGWSTDTRFYSDCVVDGWDTAVVSDYRDMTLPEIPTQYSTIYVFAYSLGVWAAAASNIKVATRVAIFGTPSPVSDEFGIPKAIFTGTAQGLTEKTLAKFHIRMAGSKSAFEEMSRQVPPNPDIEALKEELLGISARSGDFPISENHHWDRVYIANADHIIPTQNQLRYWREHPETEIVTLESAHYADISSIIRNCIPDPHAIGEGFANALPTYSKYATVQSEVCQRIDESIREFYSSNKPRAESLLEIGPGKGLLTDIWSKYLKPDKATYVDLYEMQLFGNAPDERYLVKDAEQWLESTDEKFDVILSSSAIQWFANPINFLSNVRKHLNPGGIAIISTFSKGNLRELDQLRPSPIIYHSVEKYGAIDGVKLDSWERTLKFNSSREMMMHLKRTGVKPSSSAKCFIGNRSIPLSSLPTSLTYTPLIITLNS